MSDRHELERLLREPIEALAPPTGAWDQIHKRARRRRAFSATLSVAAVVVIVAGAIPAVIAVRHSSDNATLYSDGNGHHPLPNASATTTNLPVPATTDPLSGYFPESLSFVSPTTGYLWGSTGTSRAGVVAKTADGGAHWTELPSPAINNEWVARHGASQIRFATGEVGFLYGGKDLITQDGGASWQPFKAPGYIADLEAMNGKIWALIRPKSSSTTVRLYSATAIKPTLKPVRAVPVMHGHPGVPEVAGGASIAVSGDRVDVAVGSTSFFASPNGTHWARRSNPCPTTVGTQTVRTTLVTTTDTVGVAIACGYGVRGKSQTKRLYISPNSGNRWQSLPNQPTSFGLLQTFSAGSVSDLLIGTTWGGAEITHNAGQSWTATVPSKDVRLSFVGFIDVQHIVGVADRTSSNDGAFATSYNSGQGWTLTEFSPPNHD